MSEKTQVIVVGGGASGLAAAIAAAENGAAVTLLEQNENPGRKICVTGNGRCNLTNRDMRPDIFRGQHPEFVEEILAQFTLEDTLAFFENLGVAFTDRKGWLYPRSNQAKASLPRANATKTTKQKQLMPLTRSATKNTSKKPTPNSLKKLLNH